MTTPRALQQVKLVILASLFLFHQVTSFGIQVRPSLPTRLSLWKTIRFAAQIDNTDAAKTVNTSPAALRSMVFTNLDQTQEPQLLCDFLMELGACSTSITDSDRDTDQEVPVFREPGQFAHTNPPSVASAAHLVWNKCNVVAHFAASIDLEHVADLVRTGLDLTVAVEYQVEDMPDRDWVRHVQQSWNPILVQGIVLRFPWHTQEDVDKVLADCNFIADPDRDLVQLQLEGGVAFGTGEHPTTQLCLGWVQNVLHRRNITTLMDYGSGSGVLGLAACALSSSVTAIGVDIDIDAVRIANQNAAVNGLNMINYLPPLEDTMDSESKSILMKAYQKEEGQSLPPQLHAPVHDACVANILAGPLVTLAPTLANLVVPGGLLGLSGILAPQATMVMEAYVKYFDNVQVEEQLGDWILITGVRNQNAN